MNKNFCELNFEYVCVRPALRHINHENYFYFIFIRFEFRLFFSAIARQSGLMGMRFTAKDKDQVRNERGREIFLLHFLVRILQRILLSFVVLKNGRTMKPFLYGIMISYKIFWYLYGIKGNVFLLLSRQTAFGKSNSNNSVFSFFRVIVKAITVCLPRWQPRNWNISSSG